jgi:trigger factor
MILERIKSDGASVEYKVVFDTKDIEKRIEEGVAERKKTFKVAGYRIGHAPDSMVRKSVESKVTQDVLESLISEASSKVISDAELPSLAAGPVYRFVNGGYQKGKDVEVIFTLEAAPEFELLPIELKIKKIIPEITDDEVLAERERIINSAPSYEKAEAGHKIRPGDYVPYKAICYNNGVESKKRSSASGIVIREKGLDASGFSDGFIDKQEGESFEYVPPNSKNLKYRIIIESVNQPKQISPEEFAKLRGFESLQQLDDTVRNALQKNANALAFSVHKNQILESIGNMYKFDVPPRMHSHEIRNVIDEVRRYGEDEGKSDEELKKEYDDVAKTRVILGYVISKMSRAYGIYVSDEELQAAVYAEMQLDQRNASRILDYYRGNPQAVDYKKAEILEMKVIQYLLSKAETEDIKMSGEETKKYVDEFFKDEEEEGNEPASV